MIVRFLANQVQMLKPMPAVRTGRLGLLQTCNITQQLVRLEGNGIRGNTEVEAAATICQPEVNNRFLGHNFNNYWQAV